MALRRNVAEAAGLSKADSARLLRRLGILGANGDPTPEFEGIVTRRKLRPRSAASSHTRPR